MLDLKGVETRCVLNNVRINHGVMNYQIFGVEVKIKSKVSLLVSSRMTKISHQD